MIKDSHQVSRVTDNPRTQRQIREIYGFIIDLIRDGEDQVYLPVVIRENCRGPVDSETAVLPLTDTIDSLAMRVGTPEGLLGRRVRILFTGHNWRTGVAELAPDRDIANPSEALDIPSRGFRYAVAGG